MIKVLLIFGGSSTEHDISVISAVEALSAMPYNGYKVYPAYIREGGWYTGSELTELGSFVEFNPRHHKRVSLIGRTLYAHKGKRLRAIDEIDCALLLTHGGEGESGELQGYLELQGVPYTSSDTLGSALCMDKYLTKLALADMGERVVEGVLLRSSDEKSLNEAEEKLGYPMFVKPNSQGSSIGVGVARSREELKERLDLALYYDEKALVERCIEDYSEYNCAVFSVGENLNVSEVEKPLSAGEFLSFENKYLDFSKTACLCNREFPAKIGGVLRSEIRELSVSVYQKLGLKGMVRFDYIYKDGLYLNEINTIPGSLSHYLFPSFTHTELLTLLIDEAIERGTKKRLSFHSDVLNVGHGK